MSGWSDQAECKNHDPEIWFDRDTFGKAIHICIRHCPVLTQCSREAERIMPINGVVAGRLWRSDRHYRTSKEAERQPFELPCDRCLADMLARPFENRCIFCDELFDRETSRDKYCSQKCRGLYHYMRSRLGKVGN